jgi:tetratricopeptide (TPR) repeat protein
MKSLFGVALLGSVIFTCFTAASLPLRAQTPGNGNTPGSGQNQPTGGQPATSSQNPPAVGGQNPAANSAPAQQPPGTTTQTNSNPFPEDTTSVPIIPTHDTTDLPPGAGGDGGNFGLPVPPDDADPMRSPEDAAAESSDNSSSSSLSGLRDLPPPDDDTAQHGKHKGKEEQVVPEHHETAAEDENVGSYYLENKDWKGALSRFQSALVLDPDNPDVYWGLAECERHTGDFADARANYLKVREYDPGSRHAKEAGKALEDPEIANAKPDTSVAPASQPHQ